MIKRSIEITLTIIGALAYIFFVGMYMETIDNAYGESNNLGGLFEAFTLSFGIAGIAIIICVFACIWFKGNKKPKAAGILLIIFAAVTLLMTYGGTFIGSFVYFIAGMLGMVRKSRNGQVF